MKHLLTTGFCSLLLLLLFTGAGAQEVVKQKTKEAKTKARPSAAAPGMMKGAYTMTLQKLSIDNRDTNLNTQQLKIYTDRHYMWAHALPGDTLGEFGIGTYRVQNGKVFEYPIYTSAGGAASDTFELIIERRVDGYSQVINLPPDSQGRQLILIEDYRTAGTDAATPLDGAWKMVKVTEYAPSGGTREMNDVIQYKVYQSGHVMWANSYPDSATKRRVSAFGYGTFKMDGSNRATETMTQSTYRTALVGNPVTLQLEFKGRDRYQQTISWPDGARSLEVYQRLKE